MNTKDMLFGIAIFAAGLITGIFIGSRQQTVSATPPGMSAPGGMPGGAAPAPQGGADLVARIRALQELVQKEPRNHKAWVQLGNDLFDTNQHQASIDAYAKALELQPNDPNVITDQGLMYRALGQFDQAIANFERAQKIAPTHPQSLLFLGAVYLENLNQPAKATPYFEKLVKMDPQGRFGEEAAGALARIKAGPSAK